MDKERIEQRYVDRLDGLRAQLLTKIPADGSRETDAGAFLEQNALDDALAQCVVLQEATPRGLAEFAATHSQQEIMIDEFLADTDLLRQMLLADGAKDGRYGPAFQIYADIQRERHSSKKARDGDGGVLDRLALAVSLEHAVPVAQGNPKAPPEHAEQFVNPLKRYLHYEMAFLQGELDPAFESLTVWELRMVVDGDEPDETLAWGRTMLRNFRPDHVLSTNEEWRYVSLVRSEVRYGSQDVKHDRPELQQYQNILMNGGVCGRRAFIGRFILRAFGIPTTARPSHGHGALCHWTLTRGWVVNLGPGWGSGWTKTQYGQDVDFLQSTMARKDLAAYWKVKRAQWVGAILGEERVYGMHADEFKTRLHGKGFKPKEIGFWFGVSLRTQQAILDEKKAAAAPLNDAKNHRRTLAETLLDSPLPSSAKTIVYHDNGEIGLPAAAYHSPKGTKEVHVMTSFRGGLQIYLPPFSPQGLTIMRGGTWKNDANSCCSGYRMLSGGYGKYENWGFRVVYSPSDSHFGDDGTCPSDTMPLSLRDTGETMELVYIKPGSFVMGGESTTDGRFNCVEVPKHAVQLTKGYYIGKYPVTQAQYQAIMGGNPSKSTKAPDCPVDNVGEDDAKAFCRKFTELTGRDLRLPTEAEWEYACRGGCGDTKWFFGDDPAQLGEYAWYKDNGEGKSHPVGQKKPNPWGLFDIYGNVCERVSDKYAKDYYTTSPSADPTGPSVGIKSSFEYKVKVPQSRKYSLTADIVTANYNQRLIIAVNGSETVMQMPFTLGNWQDSTPLTLLLEEGENTIRLWRDKPPQYGLAIKSFTLKPSN